MEPANLKSRLIITSYVFGSAPRGGGCSAGDTGTTGPESSAAAEVLRRRNRRWRRRWMGKREWREKSYSGRRSRVRGDRSAAVEDKER
ncbi:hypothetical protein PanWU01x14_249160 [Parasponia andersonii]|uniref:Uncharacterized protein n=1 Tax=Parasponia andersonii TaxID=3476 RepID=A0A2P5BDG5_PARAD|nr:hypothetical protein PanWU01x14_249160 [Parasponia andersonii]